MITRWAYALLLLAVLTACAGLTSCGTDNSSALDDRPAAVERYWLAGQLVKCAQRPEGCYQVQRSDTLVAGAWEVFPATIPQLEWQEGFLYHVRLQRASDTSYTLVELINRTPDNRAALAYSYQLQQLNGQDVEVPADLEVPTLLIDFDNDRISGSDGCNRFQGDAEVSRGGDLLVGDLASTRKACPSMEFATGITNALGQVRRYEVRAGQLLLRNESGAILMRFNRMNE